MKTRPVERAVCGALLIGCITACSAQAPTSLHRPRLRPRPPLLPTDEGGLARACSPRFSVYSGMIA